LVLEAKQKGQPQSIVDCVCLFFTLTEVEQDFSAAAARQLFEMIKIYLCVWLCAARRGAAAADAQKGEKKAAVCGAQRRPLRNNNQSR
jgi:hypothetical protein